MPLSIEPDAGFQGRHNGPRDSDITDMLEAVGASSLEDLIAQTVPESIRLGRPLDIPAAVPEHILLEQLRTRVAQNQTLRSFVGMGYYDTITPGVIQRTILENPGWYTQYTPYQAEISQGRLEALLNFQTMVIDLTGLEIANASLLDEGTAAAEAMTLLFGETRDPERNVFMVSAACHPQTTAIVQGRAEPLGIEVVVGDHDNFDMDSLESRLFGVLLQYPASDGAVYDYSSFCAAVHEIGAGVAVAADLLALTLLTPPGEFGADVVVGSAQRFGVPMGYGGPHAAYLAVKDSLKRRIPGRIIGVSIDADGNPALRMSLQTREQHIIVAVAQTQLDLLNLVSNRDQSITKSVQLFLGLTLRRLDHHRSGYRKRHGRSVESIVH